MPHDDDPLEPDPGHVFLADWRLESAIEQMPADKAAQWLMAEEIRDIYKSPDGVDCVRIVGPWTDDHGGTDLWTMTMRMSGFVDLLCEYEMLAAHLVSSEHYWQRLAAQRALGRIPQNRPQKGRSR